MKISLKIYNSILFGELRPWLSKNISQELFHQKLNPQFCLEKGTAEEFEKAINEALKDHPLLLQDDEEIILEIEDNKISIELSKDKIFEPLIDIDIPPYFNDKTEYYFHLIKNEGTRTIHNIYQAIELCETSSLAKTAINDTLDRLKYFLSEASTQLKQIGYDEDLPFDSIPDNETKALKKECDYILRVMQTTLLRLILEIQELFPSQLASSPMSHDEIFLKLIGKPSPGMEVARKITKLNEFLIKRFIEHVEYSKDKAIQRIDYTKKEYLMYKNTASTLTDAAERKEGLASQVMILENLLFIREFTNTNSNPTYAELQTSEIIESNFNQFTSLLFEKIEEHATPNKRLEVIAREEVKFNFLKTNYTVDPAFFKPSIPRKILIWLEIQKSYINENLHIDFDKLKQQSRSKVKTKLNVYELAYLFKVLDEADIFDMPNKTDLFRAITETFETKKQSKESLNIDSFSNKFYSKDFGAMDTMHAKFRKMQDIAFNDKKNIGA